MLGLHASGLGARVPAVPSPTRDQTPPLPSVCSRMRSLSSKPSTSSGPLLPPPLPAVPPPLPTVPPTLLPPPPRGVGAPASPGGLPPWATPPLATPPSPASPMLEPSPAWPPKVGTSSLFLPPFALDVPATVLVSP